MKQTKCSFVIREVQKYSHNHHHHHYYYIRLEKVLLVDASTVAFIMFYVYRQNLITDSKGTEPSACLTELCSYMYCRVSHCTKFGISWDKSTREGGTVRSLVSP